MDSLFCKKEVKHNGENIFPQDTLGETFQSYYLIGEVILHKVGQFPM